MIQNILITVAILLIVIIAVRTGFVKKVAAFVVEISAKWVAKVVLLFICLFLLALLYSVFDI